ncbi:MAG: hypothetical protein AB1938_11590 [Myxococcota bacterium]
MSLDHLASAEAQLKEALARLHPPFDVLSDVRSLEGFSDDALEHARRLGFAIRSAGARKVVRVVGKSANGALHMERLARQLKHAAHLAFSLEEAEAVFNSR